MREKLNDNPVVQAAVIGVLLIGAAFFLLSSMGGGEEEEGAGASEATVTVAGSEASGTATGATPGEAVEGALDAATAEAAAPATAGAVSIPASAAPPVPPHVSRAYESGRTVVLLFVRAGGIDDRRVKVASQAVEALPEVTLFVIPAKRIARYAAITQGVGVDRVPALVVLTPKRLKPSLPTASVSYGFQSPQSVVQAVIDAGYKGPTVDYHP